MDRVKFVCLAYSTHCIKCLLCQMCSRTDADMLDLDTDRLRSSPEAEETQHALQRARTLEWLHGVPTVPEIAAVAAADRERRSSADQVHVLSFPHAPCIDSISFIGVRLVRNACQLGCDAYTVFTGPKSSSITKMKMPQFERLQAAGAAAGSRQRGSEHGVGANAAAPHVSWALLPDAGRLGRVACGVQDPGGPP